MPDEARGEVKRRGVSRLRSASPHFARDDRGIGLPRSPAIKTSPSVRNPRRNQCEGQSFRGSVTSVTVAVPRIFSAWKFVGTLICVLYLAITRNWMVSRGAQRLYFVCALANLWLFAVLAGTAIAMSTSDVESIAEFPPTALLVRSLLWPGILGTAVLAIAMWYFWYSIDQSGWTKEALWLLVLFLGFMLGPLLYYFFAYRRHPALDGAA